MDYDLAALKLLSNQLKQATKTASTPSSYSLCGGVLFQRAWLQGILVSIIHDNDDNNNNNNNDLPPRFLLDDGTGVVELIFNKRDFFDHSNWQLGMYVMVVGGYIARVDGIPSIKIHKIVDLSAFPDREAMWYLEVIEACRMFYKPFFVQ